METSLLTRRALAAGLLAAPAAFAQNAPLGTLYQAIQALADSSPLELSFLKPEFRNLAAYQARARKQLIELLHYRPARVPLDAKVLSRKERDGYVEEDIAFQTAAQTRISATILIPSKLTKPAPAMVVLHDHGGMYMWGREKVIDTGTDHPVLAKFKANYYGDRSIGQELVRQGYVVIAIDMFYWGERRFQQEGDPAAMRARSPQMTEQQVNDSNRRASQNEATVARGLMTAGVTWPGIVVWDDIRTIDYLVSRPEVDAKRIGCIGLSVGGYRSFVLAALDTRIKAAVDVCWMATFKMQLDEHLTHSIGFSFLIPGMYRFFDLPDLAALIAPRSLSVIAGSQDKLFPVAGMRTAFETIGKCYAKAQSPANQKCTMYDSPHEFNLKMQADTWEWLRPRL
jgi:dienelactone hydrolase